MEKKLFSYSDDEIIYLIQSRYKKCIINNMVLLLLVLLVITIVITYNCITTNDLATSVMTYDHGLLINWLSIYIFFNS